MSDATRVIRTGISANPLFSDYCELKTASEKSWHSLPIFNIQIQVPSFLSTRKTIDAGEL